MAANSMRKRSFVKDGQSASGSVLLGYARVSKGDEQNNLLQAKALRAAGCRRLFEEVASGGRWDRPELHWFAGSHVVPLGRGGVRLRLAAFLRQRLDPSTAPDPLPLSRFRR